MKPLHEMIEEVVNSFFKHKNTRPPKNYDVEFYRDGNYTVALLTLKKKRFMGISKRNPRDPFKEEIGQRIALARALQRYADSLELTIKVEEGTVVL